MYCPECGHDAGNANFCPECGNDLSGLGRTGICPDCGADAGAAKFCPDCGQQMPKPGRQASSQRSSGGPAGSQRPRSQRRAAARQEQAAPAASRASKTPVALIWGGFAVAAAIVVVIIMLSTGGSGGNGAPAATAQPVAADTSGSYSELVDRANGLYDQGIEAFNKDDSAGGVAYFKAASEVYRAAWKKQPGDPNVGTDFAVSLFYMQHHDEGIKQIEVVLKKNPDFQPAHLNKGFFLKTEAEEADDKAKAAEFLAQAKLAFEKAVSLDPASDAGKNAAQVLENL